MCSWWQAFVSALMSSTWKHFFLSDLMISTWKHFDPVMVFFPLVKPVKIVWHLGMLHLHRKTLLLTDWSEPFDLASVHWLLCLESGKAGWSRLLTDTLSNYRDTITIILSGNYLIPILDKWNNFYLITDRYLTKLLSDIPIFIRYYQNLISLGESHHFAHNLDSGPPRNDTSPHEYIWTRTAPAALHSAAVKCPQKTNFSHSNLSSIGTTESI